MADLQRRASNRPGRYAHRRDKSARGSDRKRETSADRSAALWFRLRKRLEAWRLAGATGEVLRWLRQGVRLNWLADPPAKFHQGDSCTTPTPDEDHFLDKEISRCLRTGAWKTTDDAGFVSKAFLVRG
eukprot:SAG31_NODE_24287_length_485_cov_0.683938_2_plen_127_part_01